MAKSKSPKKNDDFQSEVLSKKEQRKLKKTLQKQVEQEEEVDAESSDEEEEEEQLDLEKLARDADSESESEEDEEEEKEEEKEEEEEEEEEDDDVPLSEVEIDSDADIVPYTKLTINNVGALKDSLARIQLPWEKHSFQEHQSITSAEDVVSQVKDIYDDTQRELAFYKQGLDAALQGRKKLLALKVPFSRPLDYFAEMVKSDEHMDKLKEKLVKKATAKKASEDARKQRSLKKFGKQVQNETLQQRQKEKRETLDKIKSLKKKRQNDEMTNDDFDIAIEEATASKEEYNDRHRKGPGAKRQAKNSKYGSGGEKRFKRKNDAESSSDVSGFSAKRMKASGGKKIRPGKSSRRRKN